VSSSSGLTISYYKST